MSTVFIVASKLTSGSRCIALSSRSDLSLPFPTRPRRPTRTEQAQLRSADVSRSGPTPGRKSAPSPPAMRSREGSAAAGSPPDDPGGVSVRAHAEPGHIPEWAVHESAKDSSTTQQHANPIGQVLIRAMAPTAGSGGLLATGGFERQPVEDEAAVGDAPVHYRDALRARSALDGNGLRVVDDDCRFVVAEGGDEV
jgi:hypothetical protein